MTVITMKFPKPRKIVRKTIRKSSRSVKRSSRAITARQKTRKLIPLNKLKKKAWNKFSLWIRMRDCENYMHGGCVAPCFTCGAVKHYTELQAGHFLSGRGNAVLFSEDGVHSQCVSCNIFKHGNPDSYWPKMIQIYGVERVQELTKEKEKAIKYSRENLENLIKKYEITH